MYFWLIYAFVSIAWVKDYPSAIRNFYFLLAGVLCIYLFSSIFRNKKNFVIAFNLMNIMILVHNFIGWYEILYRDYRFLGVEHSTYYSSIQSRIPISMLGNPNDFALLMVFGVTISLTCLNINKSKLMRVISRTVMVSSYVLVFATQSRANIIGLLIISMLIFILRKRRTKYLIILFVLFSIIIFVLYNPSLIRTILDELNIVLTFNFESSSQTSEIVRLNLIRNGFYFLLMTLGFGTGIGNIEYWMQTRSIYSVGHVTNIHNWWMEILVAFGVFVFIFYMKFYIKLMKDMYNSYRNSNGVIREISLGIFLTMVGFIIASISSSSNINKEWLWIYWAIAIAFQGYIGKQKMLDEQERRGEK